MKKTLTIAFFAVFAFILSAQQKATFETRQISNKPELNLELSQQRGLSYKGIIYFVEKDNASLSSYKNGILKWKTNVIMKCGGDVVGKPEIRNLRIHNNVIEATFGKHSFAKIDIKTGEITCLGSD